MEERTEFVHFKNGIFHGHIKQNSREGEAICLYDNGAVFIGHYQAGQPCGKCLIMLTPQIYFMGTLLKGLLEGSFTVRSPQFHIYSQTTFNRIQGEVVVLDRKNKRARVWEIQNSEGVCIREAEYEKFLSDEKILKAVSPATPSFPSLLEYFLSNNSSQFVVKSAKGKEKTNISLQSTLPRQLSVTFERERLMSVGILEDGQPCGLGYMFNRENEVELEGEFQGDVLSGEGLKREKRIGRTMFGIFQKGVMSSLQKMDEKGEAGQGCLKLLKKKIHLHALDFTNDYLNERPVFLLRNFYQMMSENQDRYNNYLKQRHGQKSSPKPTTIGFRRQSGKDQLSNSISEYNMLSQNSFMP